MCVEGMINGWTREDTNQLSSDLREEREREKKKKEKDILLLLLLLWGGER